MGTELFLAEVDGEGMLIDVDNAMSYFLNETGLFIYKLLKKGKNISQIKDELLDEYDISEKEAQKDIEDFRNILSKKEIPWEKNDI